MIEPAQEGPRDPFKDPNTASNTMQLSLKSLHLSFIKQGVELFTLNVIGLEMSMLNTASEQIMEACINRIQIDNTIDNEPLFPVVLKPRCTAGENPHNHETMAGVEPLFQFYMGMKFKQRWCELRSNIYADTYHLGGLLYLWDVLFLSFD